MNLVSCKKPNCDARLHPRAESCPQCGATTAITDKERAEKQGQLARAYPCRSCGIPLLPVEHIQITTSAYSYMSNGTTQYGRSRNIDYSYKACPQCGNPEPLKYFWIVYGPGLAFLLTAALFMFNFIRALFGPDFNGYRNYNWLENISSGLRESFLSTPAGWAFLFSAVVFGYLWNRRIRLLRIVEYYNHRNA
jgi:predicted RNA-binding Zn-ribbon protein involved in translation (DUF1610 family)